MLEIKDLQVFYGGHEVLKGVSIDCQVGEIHGLLGMNGAGKTTLFRTIYGFKKARKGACIINGKEVSSRQIAFLETSPFFYSYMKGKEYLDIISTSTAHESFDIEKWNQLFDLPLDDLIDTYSTGMRKKLAFLGIIALGRDVMILDEPFSGVDVESNEKIFQILDRLKQSGKTILLSSHILDSFTGVCDKISVLKKGLIEKTYIKAEFPQLASSLKAEIHQSMDDLLDDLIPI